MSHGRADLVGVPADTSSRSRTFRLIGKLAIWAAVAGPFAIASFFIVFVFRIGPVVLVISQRYGRGVHLGDLLIGVPFGLVAVGAALAALAGYRRGHHAVAR